MKIRKQNESQKIDIAVDARKILEHDDIELVRMHIAPGESIDAHINPLPVVFYIMAGEAVFSFEGEEHIVNAESTIEIPAYKNRGIANKSNKNLELLVIKILNK